MMTTITGPLGLRVRDSILLAMIVSAMALSACMTSQEKKQREDMVEQIKADARARLEQQERQQHQQQEQEQQAILAAREVALKEWLTKWVKDNEPYLRGLCASDPGTEHQWTWDSFQVAVSTDTQHANEAKKAGRPIVDCEQFRMHARTSWTGYTWSNITFAMS